MTAAMLRGCIFMKNTDGPKLSISLYCFSSEIHSGQLSLDDSIRQVAELKAEALEIVNTQHIEGFPNPSKDFIRHFRDTADKYSLKLSSYGTYTDTGIRTNGTLSLGEMKDQLHRDLQLADAMSFPLIRVGPNTPLQVLHEVLPAAEKLKIKLGVEIHAPLSVDHPMFIALLDTVRMASSEYLGFVPDFSCWTTRIPECLVEYFIQKGFPEDVLRQIANAFNAGIELQAVKDQAHAMGAPIEFDDLIDMAYHVVVKNPPESLAAIMPYVNHIHAKFWRMENGIEPAVPYDKLVKVILDSGYQGYISSEFEGYVLPVSGIEQTREHQNMLRLLLGLPSIEKA